jgi:hypothetical protein
MNNSTNRKKQRFIGTVGALAMSIGSAYADDGAVKSLSGFDINETSFLKNNGIEVGGWGNAGITYNAASPDNNFNGPVTFADRSGEFQLNQLNLFVQRAVATEGSNWDFGGRFDVMFGTDAIFTQAYGVPGSDPVTGQPLTRSHWDLDLLGSDTNRFYDLAMPQAYVEAYVPIGNGLNVKAGHFYTPIGYETVPAPDNFFYTHAYTMQYGEPFTHTGFLGNYTIDDNWAVVGGAVTGSATGGWDGGWDQQLGNWSGIAGTTWTSTDKDTSANITGTYGAVSEKSNNSWAMYSIVVKHNITDKTHLVLQHDHGYANGVLVPVDGARDAEWYGLNTHLTYDVTDKVVAGVRGEWFRDQNGFRVGSPGRTFANTNTGASFYAVTAGVTWKPTTWLNLRPNVRYDWADGTNSEGTGRYRPFGNNKQDQFLFSTDFTINF